MNTLEIKIQSEYQIGVWCNGSIPVSKTVRESSSLSTPAYAPIAQLEDGK